MQKTFAIVNIFNEITDGPISGPDAFNWLREAWLDYDRESRKLLKPVQMMGDCKAIKVGLTTGGHLGEIFEVFTWSEIIRRKQDEEMIGEDDYHCSRF
jgi:hypothetical protein